MEKPAEYFLYGAAVTLFAVALALSIIEWRRGRKIDDAEKVVIPFPIARTRKPMYAPPLSIP